MDLTEIETVARNGKKVQAIKLYREATGSSLREAKAAVEQFIATGSWNTPPQASSPKPIIQQISSTEKEELEYLIRSGKKISAIKRFRELTNHGLKESKDYIESLEQSIPQAERPSPPSAQTSGLMYIIGGVIILLLSALLLQ